jgi:hypothetical protein
VAALDPKGDLKAQLEATRIEPGEDAGQPHGVDVLLEALRLEEDDAAE